MANIRSAYAEVSAAALTDSKKDHTATVKLVQTDKDGWITDKETTIAGVKLPDIKLNADVVVKYTASTGTVTIGDQPTSSNYTVDATNTTGEGGN